MVDVPALVMAVAALVTALGAFVLNYLKGRATEKSADRAAAAAEASAAIAAENKAEVIKIGNQVFELGKAVDGRLTKLLALTEAAALAAGRLEGAAKEKARQEAEAGNTAKNDPWTGDA